MSRPAWTLRCATLGLLATVWLGAHSAASGQEPTGHTHQAPHGGDVVELAEHHVEFKADSSGTIQVWLLDAQEKTMAPPATGTVTLMPEAGSQVTLPLKADRDSQRLVARFDPKKLTAFQAVVSLPITGKRHNFRFRYPSHH